MSNRTTVKPSAAHAVLILTLAVFPALAQENARVAEFMDLSGMEEMTRIIPMSVLAGMDEQRQQMDPEIFSRLRFAFEQAFTAERLRKEFEAELRSVADQEEFTAALEWLRTPLSRRMTQIELKSARPEYSDDIRRYGEDLDFVPAPQTRADLIKRMADAQGTNEAAIELQVSILRAMLEGMTSLMPEDQRPPESQLEAMLSNAQETLGSDVRKQITVNNLYTYREISDEELTPYVEFWETPNGRWLAAAIHATLLRAVRAASRYAGTFLALQGVEATPKEVE